MTLDHLGQLNKIQCHLRLHKLLSNHVSKSGNIFELMLCVYRFQNTSSIPHVPKILILEYFRYVRIFCFFCLIFLPTFEGLVT